MIEVALCQFLLQLQLLLLLGEDLCGDLALRIQLHLQLLQVLHVLISRLVLRAESVLRSLVLGKSSITRDVIV